MSVFVSPRRLAAATLAAGALIGVGALPASAADHVRADRSRVEISDVHRDVLNRHDRFYGSNYSLNREWVQISNYGSRDVNLNGWTLRDEDGHRYTFRNVRLDGRSTVRVHTGIGRDTRTDVYQDRRGYVLDDRSDTLTLRNDRNRFVDSYSWRDRDDRNWNWNGRNDRHDRNWNGRDDRHDRNWNGRDDRHDRNNHDRGDRNNHDRGDRNNHDRGDRNNHDRGDRNNQNPPVQNPPVQNPPVQNPPVQNPPVQNPPVQHNQDNHNHNHNNG
ncbi:lamin tail domain-containing protein [Streptomyces sp. NPDC001443]